MSFLLSLPHPLPLPQGRGEGDGAGGLRYHENAIAIGAQTERRGVASGTDFKSVLQIQIGPVRNLLGGEVSVAAFVSMHARLAVN